MAFVTPITATSHASRSLFTPQRSVYNKCNPTLKAADSRRATIYMQGGPIRSTVVDTPKKEFLDRLKPLEKVRLIVRNEAGIMESIATFDGLFFASIRGGEYANLIDSSLNLDLHLLLNAVSGCRFDIGVSRTPDKSPTYALRLLASDKETVALSVFLQWDKVPTDIAPERVNAWKKLKEDYTTGDADTFFFEE